MKFRVVLISFCIFVGSSKAASRILVPEKMKVMGIELHLSKDARNKIQTTVDQLRGSPKYFNIKLERTAMYFPIIDRILREQLIPLDFKYLVVQESGLISDAISSSNAVGFWQFKKETATELGLRVDGQVDERINIVSATKGACGYMKRSQNFTKNYIYSLLSYYTGLGGVRSHIDPKYQNALSMKIDGDVHWYVLKYLAHVVAYRNADYTSVHPPYQLAEYTKGGNMTLKEVARNTRTEPEIVEEYNKWLKTTRVPNDRVYHTILPIATGNAIAYKEPEGSPSGGKKEDSESPQDIFPDKTARAKIKLGPFTISILWNGIPAVLATKENSLQGFANFGGIEKSKFLKYNDLKVMDVIQEGQIYYLKPKKRKSTIPYHVLAEGESLWEVSQKYGIRMQSLLSKNRIAPQTAVKAGAKLWLKKKRPTNIPMEIVPISTQNEPPVVEEVAIPEVTKEVAPDNKFDTSINARENLKPEPAPEFDTLRHDFHMVSAGETLYGISRRYGLSVSEIKELNNLALDQLQLGQVLKVNKVPIEEGGDEYLLHRIEAGQTLYRISKMYEVPVNELMQLNEMQDYSLRIGNVIKIKKK